jgi:hypothetical protein
LNSKDAKKVASKKKLVKKVEAVAVEEVKLQGKRTSTKPLQEVSYQSNQDRTERQEVTKKVATAAVEQAKKELQ